MSDIQLYSIERGTGEPLILLHGNGEESRYFARQIRHFAKTRKVIAIDTRGHGQSPRGNAPFTIRQFAEDLHDFMDEQEIAKADLLGFSDGGNIALVFALKYPERVDRLILNGANLYSAGVKPSVQIPIILGYHAASLLAGKSEKARKNAEMLGLMVNDPDLDPEEISENSDPDFLRIPKLVIAGNRDMIKDEHTRLIYASLPNAQIRVMKGSHFIAKEDPEGFNRIVEGFLKQERQR